MNLRPALPLLATLLACGLLSAQPSLAGPRLFPRGARAPGIQETTFDAATSSYLFTLKSETGAVLVQYRLPLTHANVQRGVLRIEETSTGVVPMAGGGLSYRTLMPGASGYGRPLSAYDLAFSPLFDPFHTGTLLNHTLNAATGLVTVRFRDDYLVGAATIPSEKTYELRLVGRSLEIHATSDFAVRSSAQYNHAGFGFGPGDGLAQPNLAFHLPYMDQIPVFVGGNGVFVSRMVDWYRSNGSAVVGGATPAVSGTTFDGGSDVAVARNDLFNLNAPIDETVYLTVATEVSEVFPVIDRAPSAYRQHLADRAVAQLGPSQTYAKDQAWVARAQSLGLSDVALIKWDWSKWPLNLNSPDLIPATPGVPCGTIWGTQAEWLSLANTAAAGNWAFAPYFEEAGSDYGYNGAVLNLLINGQTTSVALTNNPVYNSAFSVRDAAGTPTLGWDTELNLAGTNLGGQNPPVGHQQEILGPHLRAGILTTAVDAIHGVGGYTPFAVAGAHTDAATEVPDSIHVDQRSGSGFPKTIAENLKWREQSFAALKDGMEGPLFGENSHFRFRQFESFNAGLLDGTSRKIPIHWAPPGAPNAENQNYFVVPDFELGEVLPKATGMFGMGWESHFALNSTWGFSDAFVDAWDATLLSYGHAPYFGTNGDVPNNVWDWQRNLRSYFLCHGISTAMRTSTVTQVRYVDASNVERTLSQALVQVANGTLDLTVPRLVLRFANGLEFKANHSGTNWSTSVLGVNYTIPPNGFVGAAPGGLLALSALNGSFRVDYAFNPGHSEVIDRRDRNQSYNGFPGSLLPVPATLPQFTGVNDKHMVIVKDLRTNRAIYGSDLISGHLLGTTLVPNSLTIQIDDTATLSLGRPRLGLRAILSDPSGIQQDVTGLVAWSSSDATKVTVNRFGGLALVGTGNVTITANLASLGLTATRAIQATRLPVLTPMQTHAVTATKAFLALTTDSACATSFRVINSTTGASSTVSGRPDPAQKVHHLTLRGLTPLTTYVVTPTAVNTAGLSTTGPAFTFTTL